MQEKKNSFSILQVVDNVIVRDNIEIKLLKVCIFGLFCLYLETLTYKVHQFHNIKKDRL